MSRLRSVGWMSWHQFRRCFLLQRRVGFPQHDDGLRLGQAAHVTQAGRLEGRPPHDGHIWRTVVGDGHFPESVRRNQKKIRIYRSWSKQKLGSHIKWPNNLLCFHWQAFLACCNVTLASLLGPFVTYGENEVLWIWFVGPYSQHLIFFMEWAH